MLNGKLKRGLWWMRAAVTSGFGLIETPIGMRTSMRGLVRRGFRPSSIVDVGAAEGIWTRLALRCWPKAQFVLIEPLVEYSARLNALNRIARDR